MSGRERLTSLVLALALRWSSIRCGDEGLDLSSRSQIMRSAGLCTRPAERPRRTFLPQQRREVEADQVVERAARLLRVDQVHGKLARLLDGLATAFLVIS
jgi:hypothetical protein